MYFASYTAGTPIYATTCLDTLYIQPNFIIPVASIVPLTREEAKIKRGEVSRLHSQTSEKMTK